MPFLKFKMSMWKKLKSKVRSKGGTPKDCKEAVSYMARNLHRDGRKKTMIQLDSILVIC